MQSIIHANQCLDLMERQMVGKNEVTYSELLKVCNKSVGVGMILVILFLSFLKGKKLCTILSN
jgi:hypothetical protein